MKSIISILACFAAISLHSQVSIARGKNIFYVEGGGNSIIYSINYERIFFIKNNFQFSGRVGIGLFSMPSGYYNPLTTSYVWGPPNANYVIPMEANFAFGRKRGKFELGLGYTHFINAYPVIREDINGFSFIDTYTSYQGAIGLSCLYRYEKPDGGFFLKAGLTGMVVFGTDPDFPIVSGFPWPKLVLGYKFKHGK